MGRAQGSSVHVPTPRWGTPGVVQAGVQRHQGEDDMVPRDVVQAGRGLCCWGLRKLTEHPLSQGLRSRFVAGAPGVEWTSDDLLPGSRPCPSERRLSGKPHLCPAIAAPQGDRGQGGLRGGLQCSVLGPDSRGGGTAGGGGRRGRPQVLSHGSMWGVEPQPLLPWKREMWATRHLNSSGGSILIPHIHSQSLSSPSTWAGPGTAEVTVNPARCWRERGKRRGRGRCRS